MTTRAADPRLRELARLFDRLLDRIAAGHRQSIGSIDNVRMVQFGVQEIETYRELLAGLRGDALPPPPSRNCASGEHTHCSGIFKTAGDDNLDETHTCGCDCHAAVVAALPPPPTSEKEEENMLLSLHRCKVCGCRWLLWPDEINSGGWNLLDHQQRPGLCCDNVAMGDQIEHLRDIPLSVALPPPRRTPETTTDEEKATEAPRV